MAVPPVIPHTSSMAARHPPPPSLPLPLVQRPTNDLGIMDFLKSKGTTPLRQKLQPSRDLPPLPTCPGLGRMEQSREIFILRSPSVSLAGWPDGTLHTHRPLGQEGGGGYSCPVAFLPPRPPIPLPNPLCVSQAIGSVGNSGDV